MMMSGIEPLGLGTDRRTFECDQCGLEEELLVKFCKPPQSSLRPDGRLLCLGLSKQMTLP